MRSLLIAVFSFFAFGFLLLIGYAVRSVFEDFGNVAGILASLSVAAGFVSLGALLDSRRP